jgi:secondary thiamine-phosphate synthase enzyme
MSTTLDTVIMSGERLGRLKVRHHLIALETQERLQFVDFTEQLATIVRESGVFTGFVNVQTRHTTTAMMVNENEPLLQEDMRSILESLAPQHRAYRHDDFGIRTVNLCPDEEKNGHSHCKAMFLKASETLNVAQGELQLGQWQRVFLIELDRGKRRTVSVLVMGEGA